MFDCAGFLSAALGGLFGSFTFFIMLMVYMHFDEKRRRWR
jgi:hypothetical protein